MATLQFSPLTTNMFLLSSGPFTFGQLGAIGMSGVIESSAVFGAPNTASSFAASGSPTIYFFKGDVPTNFSSFNGNLLTRSDDLLLALGGSFGSTTVSYSDPTGVRWLVGRTNTTPNSSITTNNSGNIILTRSGNVVTVNLSSGTSPLTNMLPLNGLITINSLDSTFNGTFNISNLSISGSNLVVSWQQTGNNATANVSYDRISMPNLGAANGTPTWFCMRATASSLSSNTWYGGNLLANRGQNGIGAVIGTVGAVGSGADLEINSTTIVKGSSYASLGFYMNVPYTWQVS